MIEVSHLLHRYLRRFRDVSGASCLSLYVPAPLSGGTRPWLVHEGAHEPVPELADIQVASAFASEQARNLPRRAPLPSAAAAGALLPLFESRSNSNGEWNVGAGEGEPTPRRRRPDRENGVTPSPSAWLGVRFLEGERPALERFGDSAGRLAPLLGLGGDLAAHATRISAFLTDPLTGIPDRAGFQIVLDEEFERSRRDEKPLSLLFVNPDGFSAVNDRFGREAGDDVIREVSDRLKRGLRRTEPIARFGGVIFAVFLCDTLLDGARIVADKLLSTLTGAAYLGGALRLGFSIGVAGYVPASVGIEKPVQLIRRTDAALSVAKRAGGNAVVVWEEGTGPEETGAFDRMIGLFTGNVRKDYRNMVLLWETVNAIASTADFNGLAAQVVEKLFHAFEADRVALFGELQGTERRFIRGIARGATSGASADPSRALLTEEQRALLERSVRDRRPQDIRSTGDGATPPTLCCAVPLVAGELSLGCLYLEGREDSMDLDPSDVLLLKALGKQLAVALDRAHLAEVETQLRETERRRLQAELKDLRQALQRAKLVYRSEEMESLVSTARRVAPTDATVLIIGESGTGKELLARTVHELSRRREQPMVVVDCSAITTSLIESELFGHERGAFTGAQQSRLGRLAEADGGTVFLDEIAELPLEAQSKLLRFVQEKQLTAVGGSQRRLVDVRIVAATNRDLAAEVAAGRFREDLYHRLNVITLTVPPLRERKEDILHLAKYFLESFSVQYQKKLHHLAPEVEELLSRYAWPGNVRELQNRLMQAVILSETGVLGPEELKIPVSSREAAEPGVEAPPPADGNETVSVVADRPVASPSEHLRAALAHQLDAASNGDGWTPMPFGKWLDEELVLAARVAAGGNGRAGAALLGLPSTTFQRRWSQASENQKSGLAPRPPGWDEVRGAAGRFVRESRQRERGLFAAAEAILLEEISKRLPDEDRIAAAFLGVSVATFRRRLESSAVSAGAES